LPQPNSFQRLAATPRHIFFDISVGVHLCAPARQTEMMPRRLPPCAVLRQRTASACREDSEIMANRSGATRQTADVSLHAAFHQR
jgi:hypothetical protein